MKTCNILCVCGSGTVSSAMVAGKLKERLKEKGWDAAMVVDDCLKILEANA